MSLHTTELDVRWGDLDAFNHVNNATYLDYIQEARLRWLVTLDKGWYGADIPSCRGQHHLQLPYGDRLAGKAPN